LGLQQKGGGKNKTGKNFSGVEKIAKTTKDGGARKKEVTDLRKANSGKKCIGNFERQTGDAEMPHGRPEVKERFKVAKGQMKIRQ